MKKNDMQLIITSDGIHSLFEKHDAEKIENDGLSHYVFHKVKHYNGKSFKWLLAVDVGSSEYYCLMTDNKNAYINIKRIMNNVPYKNMKKELAT